MAETVFEIEFVARVRKRVTADIDKLELELVSSVNASGVITQKLANPAEHDKKVVEVEKQRLEFLKRVDSQEVDTLKDALKDFEVVVIFVDEVRELND